MRNATDYLDAADAVLSEGRRKGVMYRTIEDETLAGRTIQLDEHRLVNFSSCSYLGLELDPRLAQGVIEAVTRYGSQFSSSRGYLSLPLYGELEALLTEVFGVPALIAPSTSLGHVAAMPILVGVDDAVILDQQVHNSVHTAANHVRMHGTHVEVLRHNRLDQLVERIEALRGRHRRIWYMVDGVYSMLGEFAPIDTLTTYLDRYEQLCLYVDDAHAMSWYGKHGRGYTLGRAPGHERIFVVTSLNKGFACAGGALLIPDADLRRKIATVGAPMVFSGPVQPPMLGAAIASARIHLSDEIYVRQEALQERIRLCNRLLLERGLPLLAHTDVPIRTIGVGAPEAAYKLVNLLKDEGFLVNAAIYPTVPRKRSGIRFTLTPHLTPEDIAALVEALDRNLALVLDEQGSSLGSVRAVFALGQTRDRAEVGEGLSLTHASSIQELAPEEWDRLLGSNGSFTWEGLRSMERTFQSGTKPEDHWRFHYYMVRDQDGAPVLATFFVDSLWKDDMLSSEQVSRVVEQRRKHDPYFLTSRALAMGSLLSEGEHLYLDRTRDWQRAMRLLLDAVAAEQTSGEASSIILRDLPADPELDALLMDQGFVRFPTLDSYVLELNGEDDEAWLNSLSPNSRRHQKRNVLAWEPAYEVEVLRGGEATLEEAEIDRLFQLYQNVHAHSYAINSFELPRDLFANMLKSPAWEVVLLRLRPEANRAETGLEAGAETGAETGTETGLESGLETRPVGMAASVVGPDQYAFMVVGLDYRYVRTHGAYRQVLLQVMRRARALGLKRVLYGLSSEGEKRCFGAKPVQRYVYVLSHDHYQSAVLAQLTADVAAVRS